MCLCICLFFLFVCLSMFSRYLIFYIFSIKELARIEKARAQLQVDYVSMYLFIFSICLFIYVF